MRTKITAETSRWRKRLVLLLTLILASLILSSGLALAATISCQAGPDCVGTRNADTLVGTDGDDRIFGRAGNDEIKAFGSSDTLPFSSDKLYGQGGSDRLIGGPDKDYLTGGNGNDALSGGADSDHYFFGPGWGNDSLVDGTDGGDTLIFDDPSSEHASVTQDLIVRLAPGDGPEVKNAGGTSTIAWEGNPVDVVYGGDGNDKITGNRFGNYLVGREGEDTISGAGGNDAIQAGDGSGGDTVNCGESPADHDVVYYDLFDQVAANCEERHLATQIPNV
jgi:Ca2+-binding RTX toxin-like protein